MSDDKKLKVTFLPGSFNNFEGTQEELDEIVAEIMRLAESGELMENSISIDEIDEYDLTDEEIEAFSNITITPRKLN